MNCDIKLVSYFSSITMIHGPIYTIFVNMLMYNKHLVQIYVQDFTLCLKEL